ncbi:MAG: hypothetical protein HUJ31_17680, partial [Pseudomonadales bacterium]|nr:hypothetical protein [Pseudomonadales bacterium]
MKYAVIVFFSLATGFFAGYLFYDSTVGPSSVHTRSIIRTIVEPAPQMLTRQPAEEVDVDLDYVRKQQTVFDKLLAAWQIAAVASPTEIERLLEQTLTINDPLYDMNIAGILLERWTAFDPEGALSFVEHHRQMNQEYFQAHVLTSWARNDPDAALAHFQGIDDPQIKFAVGTRLLSDPTPGAAFSAEVVRILGPPPRAI